MTTRIVIIGASIAGVNVAKMLRKQNFEGQITVIDQQSELPYDLLPLSKEWMLDTENVNPPFEHWEHAYHHGRTIAKNLMNEKSHPYQVRPYFWTDEYDQTFEYLGHAVDWHKTIIRGSLEERQFTIAYVDENNVPLAILFANEGDKRKDMAAFMDEKKPIDEERFKNMEVPLG